MFWNFGEYVKGLQLFGLTVNMKCFEIQIWKLNLKSQIKINRKHEMFWNMH